MNYINKLENGNKLHIKFPTTQSDYIGNNWIEEMWEYKNNEVIINYIGCNFTTEHNVSDANKFLKEYRYQNKNVKYSIINLDGIIIEEINEEYELYLRLKEKYE